MPRWLSVMRGVIGTRLAFCAAGGVIGASVGGVMWLLGGGPSGRELLEIAGRFSVIAFPVGVAFSGVLAMTSRGRPFDKLSLPRFAALGAGAGLLLFVVLGVNRAFWRWTAADAIANLVILTVMGGGSAAGALMLARRARPALEPGDEPGGLRDGAA